MQQKILGLILLICLMTISVKRSPGQSVDPTVMGSGIYLTEADFLKNITTLFAADDEHNYLERKLDDVVLTRSGKKYTLAGGSFFGYVQHGVRYRFYQDDKKMMRSYGYYKIIKDSTMIVYSKMVTSPKTGAHTWYYYSDNLTSPIKKLSPRFTQALLAPVTNAVSQSGLY